MIVHCNVYTPGTYPVTVAVGFVVDEKVNVEGPLTCDQVPVAGVITLFPARVTLAAEEQIC